MPQLIILLILAILLFTGVWLFRIRRVTILEYQKGVKYTRGRYVGTLGPGLYWVLSTTIVVPVDTRTEFITIQGQDVLSADGVTLKVSLAAEFQVADANKAIKLTVNFRGSLYRTLQMAPREIVGKEKIDALLENRAGVGGRLLEATSAKAAELGVQLLSVDIKDMMLPGEMKRVFAQVVKAQKEGQAALERARGETAALRNLANAARTMEDNPSLLQLRALQTLADSSGNTLVLGLQNGVVPVKNEQGSRPIRRETEAEGE
jgi:regulator of protease activity HflC (stomatin/prohibitin superfamily)